MTIPISLICTMSNFPRSSAGGSSKKLQAWNFTPAGIQASGGHCLVLMSRPRHSVSGNLREASSNQTPVPVATSAMAAPGAGVGMLGWRRNLSSCCQR